MKEDNIPNQAKAATPSPATPTMEIRNSYDDNHEQAAGSTPDTMPSQGVQATAANHTPTMAVRDSYADKHGHSQGSTPDTMPGVTAQAPEQGSVPNVAVSDAYADKHGQATGSAPDTLPGTAPQDKPAENVPEVEGTSSNADASTASDPNADIVAGFDSQINTLKEAQKKYEATNETPEQAAAREKRERAKRKIMAIGDGLRAISNLYFTTKGAPNMYNHEKGSMLEAEKARQDKLKAEREANRDKFLNFALKIGNLEGEKAKTLRELEAQAEKNKLAREKAAREAEAHRLEMEMQPDKARELKGRADYAESRAVTAKAEADNAPQLAAAKLATEQQRGKTEQTKQAANQSTVTRNNAAAANSNRGNVAEFVAYDSKGRSHTFHTKAAADNFAKQQGTFKEEQKQEQTKVDTAGRNGKSKGSRTTTKTSANGGYSEKPQQKDDNRPPSRRGGSGGNANDNRPPSRR